MKYPECCYRLWNNFRDKQGYVGGFTCEKGTGYDLELVSITAETLAELARENGDGCTIDFIERLVAYDTKTIHKANKDEPLGGFFLRIAKERGYIKQDK